jgi:hypothetical protein
MNVKTLKKLIIIVLIISLFTGCVDQNNSYNQENNKIISVDFIELEDNIEKYIGKIITIEGFFNNISEEKTGSSFYIPFCDSNKSDIRHCVLLYISINTTIDEGLYRITGIASKHIDTSMIIIDVITADQIEKNNTFK